MKKLLLIGLLCVASVHYASAQQHFISISGQFGEHSWLGDVPSAVMNSSFGFGTGAGVSYEFKYGHFLLSVGATGNFARSTFLSQQLFELPSNDGDNAGHSQTVPGVRGDFLYVYDFNKRKDTYQHVTVQVPLMMGGKWDKFYFLLGAKFETFSLWGQWKGNAQFSTSGDYSAVYGTTLSNMPEYGFFTNAEVKNPADGEDAQSAKFNLNVLASAEFGYWIAPEFYPFERRKITPPICRVGAYVDCGVLNTYEYDENVSPYGDLQNKTYNSAAPATMKDVEMVDLLSTNARGKLVLPFEIGVKFTVMLELPSPRPCVLCNDEAHDVKRLSTSGRHIMEDNKKKSKR